MNSLSKARLDLINPLLAAKITTLDEMMTLAGEPIEVVQAMRSWSEQQAIWLKGRNVDGIVVDPRQIVTNAPPGHSWHEFGLAGDCVPISLLEKPNWSPESPVWAIYGAKAEALGLDWGGRWKKPDLPHVQITGSFPVSPTDEVRQVFMHVGMVGVWVEAGLQVLRT